MRALAMFLIIWAQLIAGCLPAGFVLCLHSDGTTAIEQSSARCCDGGRELAVRRDQDSDRGDAGDEVTVESGDDDCCRDLPLRRSQFALSVSETAPACAPSDAALAAATIESRSLLAAVSARHPGPPRDRGPPGPDIMLRRLRSVMLRC